MADTNTPTPAAPPTTGSAPAAQPVAPAAPAAAPAVQPKPADPTAAAPAEQKPPEPKKDPVSSRLAQLAKQEREQRAKLDAERKQLEADRAEVAKLLEAQKAAKENPLAVLDAAGVTFEQLQDFILAGKQPTPKMKEANRLEGLEAEVKRLRELREKEEAEAIATQAHAGRAAWQSQAMEHAKAAGEKYELTVAYGKEAMDLAAESLERHFKDTGEKLDFDSVLSEVESYYEKLVLADPVLQSKKLRARLQTEVPKPEAQQAASKQGPTGAVPRTLLTSAAPSAPPVAPSKPRSLEDRKAEAIEGLRRLRRGT